jgi:hypothetical protein
MPKAKPGVATMSRTANRLFVVVVSLLDLHRRNEWCLAGFPDA